MSFGMLAGGSAEARGADDCPAASEPYSADSVLYDVLLNARARAVITKHDPQLLAKLPPRLLEPTLPSMTVINSLRTVARITGTSPEVIEAISRELATIPLTAEDRRARCARYDHEAPALPRQIRRPALLVFEKVTGFRHDQGMVGARAAVQAIAERRGWTVVFSDSGAVMNPRALRRFDAVFWNNVSGDVLTLGQRAALRRFVENGGGFAGVHGSGGDSLVLWDWYADTLIGARFRGHPMWPQFQEARLRVDNPDDPVTQGLGGGWSMSDEWYSFDRNPRDHGAIVLLTLDESSYRPQGPGPAQDLRMGSDHPIVWRRCIGKGRSFYSALGHRAETYAQPQVAQLLEQGLAWTMGQVEADCRR